jgi:hypothetical protein
MEARSERVSRRAPSVNEELPAGDPNSHLTNDPRTKRRTAMARETLERLKREAKTLAPEEREELRVTLDVLITQSKEPTPEEEVERRLYEAGLLREIKPPITDMSPYRDRKLVETQGRPLSEIIVEERR